MKLHYGGKYNGDPETLQGHEHEPNAVPYEEPGTMAELAKTANRIALIIFVVLLPIMYFRGGIHAWSMLGFLLYFVTLVPHEFIHAICFSKDVYLYTNLRQGMLFVIGPETMSKGKFIFMSILPNIVFGLIPFVIFLIDPSQSLLGTLGLLSIPSGAGDYLNIYNTIKQVPPGGRVYMNGMKSYWYMPDGSAAQKTA